MYTVGADKKSGKIEEKKACLNCTASFGSSVKDRNYSGWSSKALVEDDGKFKQTLKTGHNIAVEKEWCEKMDKKEKDSAKNGDRAKANASREVIKNIESSHK